MSKIFKKLKSVFVIEEPDLNASEQNEKSVKKTSQIEAIEPPAGLDHEPKVDQKYLDILFKALEESNLEGYDYLEFRETIQSLNEMGMDDLTKYKSALAMAKSLNADKPSLIDSANLYLKVLESEQTKFQKALDGQIDSKVGEQKKAIKEMEQLIGVQKEEIHNLEKKIQELEAEAEQKKRELQSVAAKLHSVNHDFKASYDYLYNQIHKDVELLKQL